GGAVAFTDDGSPVVSAEIMRRALEYCRMFDKAVLSHAEDLELTRGGVMNEGVESMRLGLRGMPAQAEEVMIHRDIELARLTGGPARAGRRHPPPRPPPGGGASCPAAAKTAAPRPPATPPPPPPPPPPSPCFPSTEITRGPRRSAPRPTWRRSSRA